jgi:hypothetical protein
VSEPDSFDITATVICAEDHEHGGICAVDGTAVTDGTLEIWQRLLSAEPLVGASCDDEWNASILVASGTPDANGQVSYTFDSTGLAGDFGFWAVYDGATGSGHPPGDSSAECANLTVESFDLDVSKSLLDGPLDDAFDDTFASGYVQGENDAGVVGVGLLHTQRYVMAIDIANAGSSDLADGAVISDVLGADWDLDPEAEDADDGLDTFCADGICDGWNSDTASCVVTHTRPASAFKVTGTVPQKQPEFILITLDGLASGESCTVTLWVMTDENPSDAHDLWEPTSCRVVGGTTAEPIYNTFTLNEGLKIFDPASGWRESGPDGTLQLTLNECGTPLDTDGDDIPDDIDPDDDDDGCTDFEEAEDGTDGKDDADFACVVE